MQVRYQLRQRPFRYDPTTRANPPGSPNQPQMSTLDPDSVR